MSDPHVADMTEQERYEDLLERGYDEDNARSIARAHARLHGHKTEATPLPSPAKPCQDVAMTVEIIWEEPPESALAPVDRGAYRDFAAALRENKGKWAVLPGERKTADSAKNTAANLRRGKMKDFPKGQFEVVIDAMKIYVRYVGTTAAAAPEPAKPAKPAESAKPAEPAEPDAGEEAQPSRNGDVDSSVVRAWARANGFEGLPDRGRMPQEVHDAYRAAHAGFPGASGGAFPGTGRHPG